MDLGDRELAHSVTSTGSRGESAEPVRESLFGEEDQQAAAQANGENGGVPYKDDFDVSRLGWIQTPTYYEDCSTCSRPQAPPANRPSRTCLAGLPLCNP